MAIYNDLLEKAEKGDREAQYLLAVAIFTGKPEGDNIYPGYAIEWFEKAANQNHPKALSQLGMLYFTGDFVEVDEEKGLLYTSKAAQLGDNNAQNNLGWYYYTSNNCPKDFEAAFYWTRKAGDAGNIYAFETLAMMYWNGQGIEPTFKDALYWLAKGADTGNPGMKDVLRQIKVAGINKIEGKIVLVESPTSWEFDGETIDKRYQCVWTDWPKYRQDENMTLQELIENRCGHRLDISGGRGTSIEDAIVINTKLDGVRVEYQVLKYLFDGQAKVVGQLLMSKDGKHYDKLQIQIGTDCSKIHEIYFNIDNFF